jgi:hypothetical protein
MQLAGPVAAYKSLLFLSKEEIHVSCESTRQLGQVVPRTQQVERRCNSREA